MDLDAAGYHKENENKDWKAVQEWIQTAPWDEVNG